MSAQSSADEGSAVWDAVDAKPLGSAATLAAALQSPLYVVKHHGLCRGWTSSSPPFP
jgi:hypothetical protein